ncbi:MAG: hypothetical protein UR25_C0002G0070 [Candidatus Nomurabacteria bacterium GW2011_GWE1_32_28]|uniref:F0F1-ATPase subunit n=1 Tax=Candidatus Nomurabacteria bacterium GW2011_GWF1_31_48 TaxID=1618767 RepID=A0A0F9YFP8_9BACT|nr:MAG: hypothetical protein UR10_C0002G0070 [Candidatus Nomurabacteria bacterium GW2011_GWF2_30_133]KKP29041.1 MAG: hypothetical protein UR18_C0001G0162 [Candidatus Nomurabacteria bacterium GW2011_GWE2_31_40]KKP30549.1 MAG: hypothetical protein UR19_C0002G0070 [Candidatus Nomurabacteria bacterium GW2011_GWF1_31_48]KKP35034.1 MAG: hypothetical protein UR25_C0002G0070 [Candidatus Nomurabacteria bacterium GW2011_GWE1_32_28]HAS80601.1 hypothetical protein [Candidatus Nomurabacteria bacterium]
MEINKNENNNLSQTKPNGGIWWKPAMEIFSEISTWIAFPIIMAVMGGKILDEHYGTKPFFLLALTGLAFLISSYGIVKAVKKYSAKTRLNDEVGQVKKEEENNL